MKHTRKAMILELDAMADALHRLKMSYVAQVDATPQTERQFEVVRQSVRDMSNGIRTEQKKLSA